jgi:DNA invertase Pin-like site-specific DNA recombinase
MFSMLGAVAEFERSLIRQRSMAGQRAARERGKHCGRPRTTSRDVERCIVKLWRSRWYTMRTLAAIFDVHESTVKRVIYRVHRPESSSLR